MADGSVPLAREVANLSDGLTYISEKIQECDKKSTKCESILQQEIEQLKVLKVRRGKLRRLARTCKVRLKASEALRPQQMQLLKARDQILKARENIRKRYTVRERDLRNDEVRLQQQIALITQAQEIKLK